MIGIAIWLWLGHYSVAIPAGELLLEDGSACLLEDGSFILLEGT